MKITDCIKPVFHLVVGTSAFQVVVPEDRMRVVTKLLLKKENLFINNDSGVVCDLSDIKDMVEKLIEDDS